jgi:hypothetical protein
MQFSSDSIHGLNGWSKVGRTRIRVPNPLCLQNYLTERGETRCQ